MSWTNWMYSNTPKWVCIIYFENVILPVHEVVDELICIHNGDFEGMVCQLVGEWLEENEWVTE